ncbi:alpha/beta hydrolase family protein [Streptomyces sp. Isolate_219]|uniref:alpha/beta hydrolase family protein n=1 Tax=Streptomyces sp. Isolate_219 TaxID=2950110 RepID=UPI0021C8D5AA|nr:alpha/beta hydrolase [Streptomyces sp. Isolate_219]MCR8574843.1 alpha/beta hydrolase [Streptomyces sp. Isolate_219]
MNRIRRGAAALLLAVTLPLPLTAAGTAVAAPAPPAAHTASPTAPAAPTRLELPRPTGPYAVGRDTLPLTDTHRKDPWVPSAGPRELMASMYYPAHPGTGGARAPYMTIEEARPLLEGIKHADALPPEQLAATRTHARTGARAIGGKHPLVVLSPGFTLNRATLSLLSEELASRGYVVALLDHAHESFGTTFPGGRTLTCVACDTVNKAPEKAQRKLMAKVANGRAADISFLIDTLTAAPGRHHAPAWRHSAMIDPKRIGTAGHSIGGNSAASAMAADRRIRAGVNMDGTFFAPVPRSGLDGRPFLMLGGLNGHAPGDEDTSWLRDWHRLDGWKRWLTVRFAGHFTFIDLPVLGAQLGVTDPDAPLSGKRSGEITRDYVTAFFDQQLRGIPRPLLDGPSAANPEAVFQKP